MKKFNRRTVLRGLGGIAISLPLLEIMLGSQSANAQAIGAKRLGIFFGGQSLGADNDRRNYFVPPDVGRNYTTSVGLKPLDNRGLKDDFSLVSGLYIPTGYGAGERGPDFHPLCSLAND